MNKTRLALGLMVPLGMEIKTPPKRKQDLRLSQQTCCVWQAGVAVSLGHRPHPLV